MGKQPEAYDDIPGTAVFDAQRARKGYHLNQFLYSLMSAANRKAFLADEHGYLKKFPMTEEQRQAVMKRDWNTLLELGGVSYALAKLAFTDEHSYQYMAAEMTGMTAAGISRHDGGGRPFGRRLAVQERTRRSLMARIIAGIGTSHTPAIGAAVDNGQDERTLLEAAVQGLRAVEEVDGGGQARRRDHGLQRSRQRLRLQDHPDLRASVAPTNFPSPTKAGARARCPS